MGISTNINNRLYFCMPAKYSFSVDVRSVKKSKIRDTNKEEEYVWWISMKLLIFLRKPLIISEFLKKRCS